MPKRIDLTQGKHAIVDDEDYEWLNQWRWRAERGKSTWYAIRIQKDSSGRRHRAFMHRVILGLTGSMRVDHKNHNGIDNRRENLRTATNQQNEWNKQKQKNVSSQYKGVSWDRANKKWQAHIMVSYKSMRLGRFTNEKEAARAYDEAARKLFGAFARTNFT